MIIICDNKNVTVIINCDVNNVTVIINCDNINVTVIINCDLIDFSTNHTWCLVQQKRLDQVLGGVHPLPLGVVGGLGGARLLGVAGLLAEAALLDLVLRLLPDPEVSPDPLVAKQVDQAVAVACAAAELVAVPPEVFVNRLPSCLRPPAQPVAALGAHQLGRVGQEPMN